MHQRDRRPVQIPDLLILIAAAAIATVLIKRHWTWEGFSGYFVKPPTGWTGPVILSRLVSLVAYLGLYPAAAAAVAFLAIRLRGPRPSRPRLGRQPGLAACAAVTLMIVLGEVRYLAQVMTVGVDNPFRSGFSYQTTLVLLDGVARSFAYNGHAVAAAWLALAIGGRWRPAPDWVDRCATAVGFFWLMTIPVFAWLSLYNAS